MSPASHENCATRKRQFTVNRSLVFHFWKKNECVKKQNEHFIVYMHNGPV